MGIQVDGLFSGIDTTSLIESLVEVYSTPQQNYEDKITDLESKQDKLSELVSLIEDFQTSLEDIEDTSDLMAYSVDYADNDALTAEVDGGAVAGTYTVEVTQVAQSEMEVSQAFSDASTDGLLATGTLTVTYGTTSTDITVDSTMSLADLADAIDGVEGVTAYVMDTGDATSPYRLVVQGEDTGADYTIDIDTSGLTGSGLVPSFTEQVSAQDAQLSINGVSITSSSNTVADAVPGITLTLSDTTTSAVELTVNLDADGVEENVQAMVDAYNAIIDYIDENSQYDADTGERGDFVGESSVQRVGIGLRTALTSQFDLGQDYEALSQIGIATDKSGTLSIDSDTFQDVLTTDPGQVANLFTGSGGFIENMLSRLDVYIDPYEGSLETRIDSIDDRIDDLQDIVDEYDDRIAAYEERLREQFTAMESLLGSLQSSSTYLSSLIYSG